MLEVGVTVEDVRVLVVEDTIGVLAVAFTKL
jgi:hypothetical protein